MRGRDVVHGVGGEEGQRPAATNAAASKDAIGGLALKPYAACKQCDAYGVSAKNFAGRPQV